jgi:hypothetical protein
MTPEEAAAGRALLDAHDSADDPNGDMAAWLWSNREELVRCAELAATETACCAITPLGDESAFCERPLGHDGPHSSDPRLAHALANPPGPRHAVVREALASARLDGETYCLPDAGGTQKPEGE